MKKVLFPILALVLALGLALPGAGRSPAAAHTEDDPFVTDLIAGQHIDVGDVTVWNDAENLYVKYETTGDWVLTETHLHVCGGGLWKIPQTTGGEKGKGTAGNPIPGQFAHQEEHDPPVTDYTYDIGLDEEWTPCETLDIAAHAVVIKVITEAPYYAASVDSYWQGTLNNGNPIPASWNRSNPAAVLALNDPLWFFSLGFGEPDNGWIIVEFDCPIRNGDGNDVQVLEVTNASPYPSETANVSASQDGSNWILLGQADNINQAYPVGLTATEFDLGSLPWARYIKVEDTTDPIAHQGIVSDAFDLEAVVSLQDCIQEESAWGDGTRFTERGNWATHFTYTVQCLTGDWQLEVYTADNTFTHEMSLSQAGGNLTGTGSCPVYSVTWTMTGTVSESEVSMTLDYDDSDYEANLDGKVEDRNKMAGKWKDNLGQSGTWTATRVP